MKTARLLLALAVLSVAPAFADMNAFQLTGSFVSAYHYTAGDGTGRTAMTISNNGAEIVITCGAQLVSRCEGFYSMEYVAVQGIILSNQLKATSVSSIP